MTVGTASGHELSEERREYSADELAEAARRVAEQAEGDPSVAMLAYTFTSITPDSVTVRMPITDGMRNAFGIAQGGFVFALGDAAFAFTATASGTPMVTHHANVTYLAPAAGAYVEARGRIAHRYGRNAVVDVEVLDDAGSPICVLTVHGVAAKIARV